MSLKGMLQRPEKLAAKWPATWPPTISYGNNELRQKIEVDGHMAAFVGQKLAAKLPATWPPTISQRNNEL